MKKHLLILTVLALIVTAFTANAQLINPGFETWTNDLAVPSAMNPNSGNATTGWIDYNFFNSALVGSSPVSVFRCDTAHGGTYSARIVTKIYTPTSYSIYQAWGIPFIGHNYLDTLGILFNGNLNESTQTYKPGIPFTQKIATLSFYYQYTPQAGDTAECRALLVHQRTGLGGGMFKTTTATGSTWHQGTISFLYVDSITTPDTLYILFSSSSLDRHPKPGSILLVDDVTVTLATGVNDIQMANDLNVYPNPTSGKFQLAVGNAQAAKGELTIYNVMGEKNYSTTINSNRTDIDLSNQPNGIYFMQLKTEQGTATKKIVVNR